MARVALLALVVSGVFQAPAPPGPATIRLEIRVFDGSQDVTADTRVAVFRTGERDAPLAQLVTRDGRKEVDVPEGFYDVQAVRERDGRVLTIRWAERLVVMPYPDEDGRHLQVVNLTAGFGALQVRAKGSAGPPDVSLHAEGERTEQAVAPVRSRDYTLFVVPAGRYDVQIRTVPPVWHPGIDVPLDRTRLWMVPEARSDDAAAAQGARDDHDQGNHQQDVNHPAGNLEHEPEHPQEQQQDDNGPQHQ